MCDILIVSSSTSQAADTWVQYLSSCFDVISQQKKRQPYKVVSISIEELQAGSTLYETSKARLQIVVLCPLLQQTVCNQPSPVLNRVLQSDCVLAMLLGVEENSVADTKPFSQWKRMKVKDQDESFVGLFLEEAMGLLNKTSSARHRTEKSKPVFSIMPKKVKEGQNKVLVLLNDPITKEDRLTVTIDKQGQLVEVSGVKLRNPYTLTFSVPLSCLQISLLASVSVFINGKSLGSRQIKCESRLRELEQLLRCTADNPLQLMCQTLGFNDRDQLDSFLVSAFQRNVPPHFNLLQSPNQPTKSVTSLEEVPTLLHFAALHGLEKLAWQLLECPGGEAACEIRNANDLTPADLAERNSHTKLATQLRGYMQMNEFTSMYSYMKVMSEGSENQSVDYHKPRPLSQTYQVPRSPLSETYQVPRNMDENYQVPRNMEENYKIPRSFEENYQVPRSAEDNYQVPPSARPYTPPVLPPYMDMHNLTFDLSPLRALDTELRGPKEAEAAPQQELLDIINDFKNNVFTISEVENLVATWRTRHDVQQSFKDKQTQLIEMREEYERLQVRMKSSNPFDRIRNFFRGNKPKESAVKELPAALAPLADRHQSTLSLHSVCSSTSSGRMSTASANSGIHSDPEGSIRNYEVPPAPRPIAVPSHNAPDIPIEERPPCPVPRPEIVEEEAAYYISCPEPVNDVALQAMRRGVDVPDVHEAIPPVDDEYLDFDEKRDTLPEYINFQPSHRA